MTIDVMKEGAWVACERPEVRPESGLTFFHWQCRACLVVAEVVERTEPGHPMTPMACGRSIEDVVNMMRRRLSACE